MYRSSLLILQNAYIKLCYYSTGKAGLQPHKNTCFSNLQKANKDYQMKMWNDELWIWLILYFSFNRPSDRNIMTTNIHKKADVCHSYISSSYYPSYEEHHKIIRSPLHANLTYTIWTPPSSPYQIERKNMTTKEQTFPATFQFTTIAWFINKSYKWYTPIIKYIFIAAVFFSMKRIKGIKSI